MIIYSPYTWPSSAPIHGDALTAGASAIQPAAGAGQIRQTTPTPAAPGTAVDRAARLIALQWSLAEHVQRTVRAPAAAGQQGTGGYGSDSLAMERTPTHQPFDISAVGDNVVIPAAAGYHIAIYALQIWNTATQDVRFRDGVAGNDLVGPLINFPGSMGNGYQLQNEPHFVTSKGSPFVINLSAGGRLTGYVKYRMLERYL